jgi:hypothetical protein
LVTFLDALLVTLLEAGFEEFLRDFLDIRLPFVAFSGSVWCDCGSVRRSRLDRCCDANMLTSEYGYKGFDATHVPCANKAQQRLDDEL